MRKLILSPILVSALLFSASDLRADHHNKKLYPELVAPVLMAKCAGCHGEEKQKGKLRVDTLEAIMKGGSEGESVIPGKVDDSSLIQRVYLPLDDDEHMPPEDKEQLTEQETAVLAFWIQSGAKADATIGSLKPDEKTSAAIAHVIGNLPEPEKAVAKADAPKRDEATEKLVTETIGRVEKSGASLMSIAQDTPELRFSALNVAKEFQDNGLAVTLNPEGFARYDGLANAIAALDVPAMISLYEWLSPAVTEAWSMLGYTNTTFEEAALTALGMIMLAPDTNLEARLIKVEANWVYEDEALESLPPIQKQIMRMGPDNAEKLQAKARELRGALLDLKADPSL